MLAMETVMMRMVGRRRKVMMMVMMWKSGTGVKPCMMMWTNR